MPRNKNFTSDREPLREHPHLHLHHRTVHGPSSVLNPTRAIFSQRRSDLANGANTKKQRRESDSSGDENNTDETTSSTGEEGQVKTANDGSDSTKPAQNVQFQWTSRNNRKGRSLLLVDPDNNAPDASKQPSPYLLPKATNHVAQTLQTMKKMCTECWYWDVSYLVATLFTLGSVVWVINGFFVFLPLVQPQTEFKNEILLGGGLTAFIGATIFEVGSVLLMFEAINANQSGCFGWALERLVDDERRTHSRGSIGKETTSTMTGGEKIRLARHIDETDHHTNKSGLGRKVTANTSSSGPSQDSKSWVWCPTAVELRTHYMYELGFLASLAQLIGASIFWIAGLTSLPWIEERLSQGLLDGIYWVPQIVGGSGFIISG